jgi:hypothetical protein
VRPPRTLYDKVFEDHIVDEQEGNILLYIGKLTIASRSTFSLTGA